MSSSKRDAENNSEFDKFESYLTKQNEALYIQNKVNCHESMKNIEMLFGPFDQKEIDFYTDALTVDNVFTINSKQREWIFNLFYKYFGDTNSIYAINREEYVKLVIAAKRMLQSNNMVQLPYILSGKFIRIVPRKIVNKKDKNKLLCSPYYKLITEKYKNSKIMDSIDTIIATILASEFEMIDYNEPLIHGRKVDVFTEYICEEILLYVNLC